MTATSTASRPEPRPGAATPISEDLPMIAATTDPMIIDESDPQREPEPVTEDSTYFLYDEDFPLDPYTGAVEGGQPLRYPNLDLKTFAALCLPRKGKEWMRNRRKEGHDTLNGKPFPYKRKGTGARVAEGQFALTLPDAERLLHALYQNGRIDGVELTRGISALISIARVHNVMPRTTGKS